MNTIYQWAIIGLILIAAEILVGNFVLLLFGVTALVVAGLQLVVGEQTLLHNSLFFAFIGVIGTLWLKKKNFFQKQGKSFSSENEFYLDKNYYLSSRSLFSFVISTSLYNNVNLSALCLIITLFFL